MKVLSTLLLASTATAAAITARAPTTATVIPYLAPACSVSGIATGAVCNFPTMALTAGTCVDVTYQCSVHNPASFTAALNAATTDGTSCKVAVFKNAQCVGDSVVTGVLGTAQSTCIESPFFSKALDGGVLSSSLLPFGFASARLDCA